MDHPVIQHPPPTPHTFDEEQWLRILFLISDTQAWLNEMQKEIFFQVPMEEKKKLFRKTYYITATSLAHILERHYYKIHRYPNTGKFTIPVTEILACLREAFHQPAATVNGTLILQRVMDAGRVIGFDQYGRPTGKLTIITDMGGRIVTAFPGIKNM